MGDLHILPHSFNGFPITNWPVLPFCFDGGYTNCRLIFALSTVHLEIGTNCFLTLIMCYFVTLPRWGYSTFFMKLLWAFRWGIEHADAIRSMGSISILPWPTCLDLPFNRLYCHLSMMPINLFWIVCIFDGLHEVNDGRHACIAFAWWTWLIIIFFHIFFYVPLLCL